MANWIWKNPKKLHPLHQTERESAAPADRVPVHALAADPPREEDIVAALPSHVLEAEATIAIASVTLVHAAEATADMVAVAIAEAVS